MLKEVKEGRITKTFHSKTKITNDLREQFPKSDRKISHITKCSRVQNYKKVKLYKFWPLQSFSLNEQKCGKARDISFETLENISFVDI